MTVIKERPPEITPEIVTWEVELQKVGLVRRILNARRWYGADWWFVTISAVLVLIFIIVALFPNLFAPYQPDALVGPSFLAPGAYPPVPVLVVLEYFISQYLERPGSDYRSTPPYLLAWFKVETQLVR